MCKLVRYLNCAPCLALHCWLCNVFLVRATPCRGERWSEMLHAKDDSDPHVADIASMLDLLPLR